MSDLASLIAQAKQRDAEAEATAQRSLEKSWLSNDGELESAEDVDASLGESEEAEITAYKFHVHSASRGDGYVWLRHDRAVECVSPKRPNDLLLITPDGLEPGDVVLRLHEGGRADLFDKIVELAENQPHLAYLSRFRHTWQDALERIAIKHRRGNSVDYSAILTRLRQHGATIQSALTVRNWVEHFVIGPEDLSSIVAIGRVAAVDAVSRNAKDFDRAFRRIRGIHQGIGRRLNSAIRHQFHNFATGQVESPHEGSSSLDSRLGIPLEELLESVEYLQVLELPDEPKEVSSSMLSRFIIA